MMGCLKLYNEDERKGILIDMSKSNGKNKNHKNNKNENGDSDKNIRTLIKWMRERIKKNQSAFIVGVSVALVSNAIIAIAAYLSNVPTLNSLQKQMNELSTKVDEFSNVYQNDKIVISSEIDEMNREIGELIGFKDTVLGIPSLHFETDREIFNYIEEASVESNDNPTVSSGQIYAETYIGTDSNGVDYTAEDWVDKTVLISYEEEEKEVYFLGQYNENYHWDGYCVTNSYNADGTLYGICESNFDDGKRLDYISFYQSGENEWIYANRQLIEGENVGVTINYYIDDNKEKNFTLINVRITDILYADSYIESEDKVITKYYTGNTVNNMFEDSTEAYEVKFDKDGTVRMLYVGRFKDGYCNDSTGKAFSIVYSDEYNAYVCNTGKFSNGHAETHSTEPITIDEINEIIKDYTFDCELNWKE